MLWTIAIVLIVLWALGFFTHVAGGLIHVLLVVAVIMIVLNLVRRGGAGGQIEFRPQAAFQIPQGSFEAVTGTIL